MDRHLVATMLGFDGYHVAKYPGVAEVLAYGTAVVLEANVS